MTAPNVAALTRRWLAYAEADLRIARRLLTPPAEPDGVCYHAQQAAEKALKAALIFEQIEPPKIHSLDALRNLLPIRWTVRQAAPTLQDLSDWVAESRYPGNWPGATVADASAALVLAETVVAAVRADLTARSIT
ncbi:MAG: HEPN domain-containing protein [Thermomicrobiales bacterium]